VNKSTWPSLLIRFGVASSGVLLIVALLCVLEKPVYAYVDPGSGFVFLQVVGSMAAGALFYLRHRLKKMFSFMRRSGAPETTEAGVSEPHS
jgi:hypothetical protein